MGAQDENPRGARFKVKRNKKEIFMFNSFPLEPLNPGTLGPY
jgi:hypothetical protein